MGRASERLRFSEALWMFLRRNGSASYAELVPRPRARNEAPVAARARRPAACHQRDAPGGHEGSRRVLQVAPDADFVVSGSSDGGSLSSSGLKNVAARGLLPPAWARARRVLPFR